MSLEANKQIVREYFEACEAADFEALDRIIADDAKRWMIPSTPFSGVFGKDEIIGSFRSVCGSFRTNPSATQSNG